MQGAIVLMVVCIWSMVWPGLMALERWLWLAIGRFVWCVFGCQVGIEGVWYGIFILLCVDRFDISQKGKGDGGAEERSFTLAVLASV
jgi:hypothetical protein